MYTEAIWYTDVTNIFSRKTITGRKLRTPRDGTCLIYFKIITNFRILFLGNFLIILKICRLVRLYLFNKYYLGWLKVFNVHVAYIPDQCEFRPINWPTDQICISICFITKSSLWEMDIGLNNDFANHFNSSTHILCAIWLIHDHVESSQTFRWDVTKTGDGITRLANTRKIRFR